MNFEATALDIDLSELTLDARLVPDPGLGIAVASSYKLDELMREVIPLEAIDLEQLLDSGPSRSQSGVQHIRAFHHNVAMRLAAGEKPVQICAVLRIQPQTVTKLCKDEQFKELIELYRAKVVERVVDSYELMSLVTEETLMALHEKLTDEEERKLIPFEALRRTAETFADRTGHSPVRRSETLSRQVHELSTDSIERIKALHAEHNTYEVKSVLSGEIVEVHKTESKSQGAGVSITDAFKPAHASTAEGDSSGGEGV